MYKIDNKYQKAKTKNLEQRLDFQKYNIKEKKKKKKNQSHKNYLKKKNSHYIYIHTAFALKIGSFFEKYQQVIKRIIKGVIEDLKNLKSLKKEKRKKKNDHKNSKDISRTFSGVFVGSVHFWIVPWSGLYFSRSIGPFLCSRY